MADLSEDFLHALLHPKARDMFREVVQEALAHALAPPTPSPPAGRLLTSAAMARAVSMSRSCFLALVSKKPEILALKRKDRWPEEEVARAIRALEGPSP